MGYNCGNDHIRGEEMTIKGIAKLAGVSTSTVSRVLNDSGYVKQEVRERIEHIIEETGYMPSAVAKGLKDKKTNLIGVIIPRLNSITASLVVEGITRVLDKKGYTTLLANTRFSFEKELEFIKLFKQKRVNGILFVATRVTKEHAQLLKKIDLPTVFIGQDASSYEFPSVMYNDYEAAKDMTEFLIKKGHKKIGFIGVEETDIAVGYERKRGYFDAHNENNIEIDEKLIATGNFEVSSVEKSMEKIMDKNPSVIFAVTDTLAVGAINYLVKKGYRIPEDVSVVGMGDAGIAEIYNPSLTTIKYEYLESGEEAAKLLIDSFEKNISLKKVMGYKLIERSSTRSI